MSPLDLNAGILEYMLHSVSVISPGIIVVVGPILLILIITVRLAGAGLPEALGGVSQTSWIRRLIFKVETPALPFLGRSPAPLKVQVRSELLVLIGFVSTVIGIYFYLNHQSQVGSLPGVGSSLGIRLYLLVVLLAGGPLIATWATRRDRYGRFLYAIAIAIAAVCVIWAISVSAYDQGRAAAIRFANTLSSQTEVVVYSVQRLSLSGPGVIVQQLPGSFRFQYRYQGLRLLTSRSGTYFLLPVGWRPDLAITYVMDQSDQTRIELVSF